MLLVLVKAMKNPRSALSKTSIMASTDIFNTFGDELLQPTNSDAFDHMVWSISMILPLLHFMYLILLWDN